MKHPFRVALVVVAGLCAAAAATEHAGGADKVSCPRKYSESWSAEVPSGRYIDVTEVFSFDQTDLKTAKVKLSADGTKAAILATIITARAKMIRLISQECRKR